MAIDTDPIQRFAALLRQEWSRLDARHQSGLDTEDLLDMFWLANQIRPAAATATPTPSPTPTVTIQQGQNIVAPLSPATSEPKAAVYSPSPPTDTQPDRQPGFAAGLPLQIPAANALRSQLDLARAMRPLMRKIASPTQRWLDEEATAVQIAEQEVWSPVLVPAPERWFDLAIVVEESASLPLWQDTIGELQTLVEQQGAFRQIRVWGLKGNRNTLQLSANWQPNSAPTPERHAEVLLDPTGRRMIWVISDCTSELWDYPRIYNWLEKLGKQAPLAIVQLFPERLWPRTALGVGQPMYLHAGVAGATQAVLSAGARPIYPDVELAGERQAEEKRSIVLPVISLEPEPVSRWVQVTMGMGDAVVAGLRIELDQLEPQTEVAEQSSLTPEQQVQQFCATASITAQKLAGLMAAVPVSLPVVHLIQKTLLPQSRQVHVAEVFMSGLLEQVPLPNQVNQANQVNQPRQMPHYRFPEAVREKLVDAVPIFKTTQVLDTVSAYISERLGLGSKSFAALIAALPELKADQQQAVQPFAEIALSTLHRLGGADQQQTVQPFAEIALSTLRRLGGDYRVRANQLAPYLNPSPLEATTQDWPPLQEHRYQVARVEVEPLQRFEFETAVIEQKSGRLFRRGLFQRLQEWEITKSSGYGWQRVEALGNEVQLELVEIIGDSFQMGSPKDEPERFDNEDLQHEVMLKDFFIGKYPITQAQWKAVAALPQVNLELDPDPSRFKGDNLPVEQVSWYDAIEFCARLSAHTGREYDLPTEAEWEYACRAGTTTPFHFGEMITTDLANYDGNSTYNNGPKGSYRQQTTPIATFPANAWGLYDMHGNVWEWCVDHWHDSYVDKPEALKADGNTPWRSNNETANWSLRGGSWINSPRRCRSALRSYDHPVERHFDYGFRVVCRAARTQ